METFYGLFYGTLCFGAIGLALFLVGVLFGSLLRNDRRMSLFVNQNRGEALVRKTLLQYFQPPNFHLLNNITLPFGDGTTQTDHILVSTKGIFVIEVKHYSGWIFANEKSKQWTQVIYRVKNKFQNPLRQNYKHLKAVQELLDFLPAKNIHSLVVFTGSAKFKTVMPKGVVFLQQLPKFVAMFDEDVLSLNRMQFCVGRLECTRYEISKSTDIHHNAYLQKKFGNQ